MNVLLYTNLLKDGDLSITAEAAALLRAAGAHVLLLEACRRLGEIPGAEYLSANEAAGKAEAVVTVGGDGTMLQASRRCIQKGIPLMGINVGRMGFLTNCEVGEMAEKLPRIPQGRFSIDERSLLRARVHGAGSWEDLAVNDIVLYNGNHRQAMDFSVFCDGHLVSQYSGDGLIVATPTGSTAYSLSAGGPVLDAGIDGFVLNAICAHNLKSPPMVLSAKRWLTVRIEPRTGDSVYICSDGDNEGKLSLGSVVEILQAREKLRLIALSSLEQFTAIDRKLMGR